MRERNCQGLNFFSQLFATIQGGFFKLLYTRLAWGYDLVAWVVSAGRWNDWAAVCAQYIQGRTNLEIGHGTGHLLAAMTKKGLDQVGLDQSRQMGRITKKRLFQKNLPVRLVNARAQALPFPAQSWDLVISVFPTKYIFETETIGEIRRVLIPGGELLVLLSAWPGGRGFFSRLAVIIFQITGQIPPGRLQTSIITEPYERNGFIVSLELRETHSDRLLFLIAKRPA